VIAILTGLFLLCAGMVNLLAGFLAIFPGLLEVGLSRPPGADTDTVTLGSLLATPYGRYALGHLLGAAAQLAGGGYTTVIARARGPLVHSLAALCVVTLGLELWGWTFKGELTRLAIPGFAAALLCASLYVSRVAGRSRRG
jgi:hypothetical protein